MTETISVDVSICPHCRVMQKIKLHQNHSVTPKIFHTFLFWEGNRTLYYLHLNALWLSLMQYGYKSSFHFLSIRPKETLKKNSPRTASWISGSGSNYSGETPGTCNLFLYFFCLHLIHQIRSSFLNKEMYLFTMCMGCELSFVRINSFKHYTYTDSHTHMHATL
jgi:hypothetical protein